jgi:hypothetical protein
MQPKVFEILHSNLDSEKRVNELGCFQFVGTHIKTNMGPKRTYTSRGQRHLESLVFYGVAVQEVIHVQELARVIALIRNK